MVRFMFDLDRVEQLLSMKPDKKLIIKSGESLADCISRQNMMAGFNSEIYNALNLACYEIRRLRSWVNDLQSGMYVNCVYCGYRYGPEIDTPVSMAEILKEHIEQCPDHPMSKLKIELIAQQEIINKFKEIKNAQTIG